MPKTTANGPDGWWCSAPLQAGSKPCPPGASRMLGVPAAFLTGKLLVSFAAAQSRRQVRSLMSTLAATPGSVDERVLTLQPRGGSPFPAEIRAVAHPSRASGETEIR